MDAAVILMLQLLCLSSVFRSSGILRKGRVRFGNPLSYSLFGLQRCQPCPTASTKRSLTLSRSVLLGKRESYRERQGWFPVLVNHISVQFPSVLFGNGRMTGVIYHTDWKRLWEKEFEFFWKWVDSPLWWIIKRRSFSRGRWVTPRHASLFSPFHWLAQSLKV